MYLFNEYLTRLSVRRANDVDAMAQSRLATALQVEDGLRLLSDGRELEALYAVGIDYGPTLLSSVKRT